MDPGTGPAGVLILTMDPGTGPTGVIMPTLDYY